MGLKETLLKHTDPEVLRQSMSRLGVSVSTAFNPNHRHDEEHEKEQDRQLQAICDSHRFKSFAGIREGNKVGWYSDGLDYFWALSEAIDKAEDCILILDWWLTPELYLRRPPGLHQDYRLDRLLKRKAEQGVKIFIMVYKEVTQSMTLSSAHTKHYLEGLHDNIVVMRHPDHLGGEVVLYWSHHDKVVVVDNELACVGGLDICFGRWDTPAHPFADVHPTGMLERTLFPGQDYNNARIEDFQTVSDWGSNQQSNVEIGRMPWHDVHAILQGPSALDVAHNFIERWNFVKEIKYKHESHYPWLAFPHGADPAHDNDLGWDSVGLHPRTAIFHRLGQKFRHPFHAENREWRSERPDAVEPGKCAVQILRSAGDWSSGILTEHSIQNAYIQLIRESSHCIYIENQFFVTATHPGAVQNVIGAAIVERIIAAHQQGKRFKVVIVIPTIPCFAGEFDVTSSIRCIMNYQYKAICRGGNSICEQLRKADINPDDYISFYNLRGYDRLNTAPIKHMEEKSGVSWHEAQVALARVFLGDHGYQSGQKKVAIKKASEQAAGPDKKPVKIAEVDLPATEEEALAIIHRFQDAAPEDCDVRDSIATNILHGQGDTAAESWWGNPDEEKSAFVTEETYIHSKLMIVDDRTVLIGSANINDRSQNGDRDSETAMVIEDREMIESKMNGEKYMASRFAFTFRKRLWRQHLGMIDKEECTPEESRHYPTPAMKAPPHWDLDPARLSYRQEFEELVEDPLGEEVERIWKEQSRQNTDVYDEVFRIVPTDKVRTWKQYHEHFPKPPIRTGHVADPSMPLDHIKQRLSTVRGSLVNLPLHFMEDEKLDEETIEVNDRTLPIYV